ncbi:NAD(P)-dependent oxidoreductase [Microvirga arabica]|uniref:NAD(P)-dependent oxidoreductase n=1 Tax=Microvirga arabica TaxID=1128671 RepID=A0ABV6Y957_9HYPH|nr:NAD(P)-dependent oxidoreductase [Microvirga arabica]MBM1173735.1 NAD(P)-dependent oxidoreductase [Microvirga arabica]
MRIGVIGLGRMGAALASRLQSCGHDLVIWNRTPGKAESLVEAGAALGESPAAVVEQAETIITCLLDENALDEVFNGDRGILSADLTARLFIEMSTVQPRTQRTLAGRVKAKGAAYVECPVSGSTGPAREGRLIGLVGGTPEDVARARPIIEQLCRRFEHAGPVGAGASLKLAVNLPLVVYYQALGEAYSLCRHLGIEPERIVDLFSDTSGGANILKARGAMIAKGMRGDAPQPVTFDIDSFRKDLRTMLAEGAELGLALPVAERTLSVYDEASQQGWGPRDGTSLAGYWPSRASDRAAEERGSS